MFGIYVEVHNEEFNPDLTCNDFGITIAKKYHFGINFVSDCCWMYFQSPNKTREITIVTSKGYDRVYPKKTGDRHDIVFEKMFKI